MRQLDRDHKVCKSITPQLQNQLLLVVMATCYFLTLIVHIVKSYSHDVKSGPFFGILVVQKMFVCFLFFCRFTSEITVRTYVRILFVRSLSGKIVYPESKVANAAAHNLSMILPTSNFFFNKNHQNLVQMLLASVSQRLQILKASVTIKKVSIK